MPPEEGRDGYVFHLRTKEGEKCSQKADLVLDCQLKVHCGLARGERATTGHGNTTQRHGNGRQLKLGGFHWHTVS